MNILCGEVESITHLTIKLTCDIDGFMLYIAGPVLPTRSTIRALCARAPKPEAVGR